MASKPPALGGKINAYFKLRTQRLKLEKEAGKIKTKEGVLQDTLIVAMNAAKIDSAKGSAGTVSLTRPEVFRSTDWPKLFAWIKKTGNFEVLSPRLHQSNIAEQLESDPKLAKKGLPGVETAKVTKFHATATKKGK